jgi:hypothetical protein
VKKLFQISFAIIYLFLTTGFTITLHYCGGIVNNVSVVRTYGDKDPCGCDDNKCESSCCSDEIQTIKLIDSHKPEAKFNQNIIIDLIGFLSIASFLNLELNQIEYLTNHLTGDTGPPYLYLHNRTILI